MQDQLIFLVSPPRSGSTLLARMLGAHSAIHAPAEPHLITPLAHLGFYARVDAADYDPIISEAGIREVVRALPGGESDYLEALRAYTDQLYQKLLAPSGAQRLLDKTPAYALVLDFLARLYPEAHYVVLTRHPMAVWASYVESFFDGDQEVAHAHNPLLERYVPAMARFLREAPVPLHHVRYEDLVMDPAAHMEQVCHFLELPFEPGMVDYGSQQTGKQEATRGLGDPMTVAKQSRPTTQSLARWASDWAGKPAKVSQGRAILEHLLDADLETWGYDREGICRDLDAIPDSGAKGRTRRLSRYSLERRLVVLLRRNIQHNALGKLVRKIRWACDVLLR
jgi:hypothetical protein